MKYLINSSTDPHFNMSLDEYCLEQVPSDEPFFYLWRNRPAVIIGLNQNAYSEVNLDYLNRHGIILARRVTGGGAVYHDLQNMNYTIIGRQVGPQPMVEALRNLGVPAELTGRNDIFVEGRKVSGYARRVRHNREIVHGTLMYDVDLETLSRALDTPGSKMNAKGIASIRSHVVNLKEYLPGFSSLDELQAELQERLSAGDAEIRLSEDQLDEVRKIAREKFSTWEWIYGHSHEADFSVQEKFACGTVEVRVRVDHGLISEIVFTGDFLGDLSTKALEERLVGLRYEKDTLAAKLREEDVSRYFEGIDPEQLARLIVR
jgi:lipoate-protein ligase A